MTKEARLYNKEKTDSSIYGTRKTGQLHVTEWNEDTIQHHVAIVQSLSRVWLFVTPWTAVRQATLSFTVSWSLLKLMSMESVMPCHHLILCHPLLLLPSIIPSISLFQWVGSSYRVATSVSVLPVNIQGWIPLRLTGLRSLLSKGLSRVFSSTTVQKHQFFRALPSLRSNSHIHTRLLEKPQPWLYGLVSTKWCLCFLICCLSLL